MVPIGTTRAERDILQYKVDDLSRNFSLGALYRATAQVTKPPLVARIILNKHTNRLQAQPHHIASQHQLILEHRRVLSPTLTQISFGLLLLVYSRAPLSFTAASCGELCCRLLPHQTVDQVLERLQLLDVNQLELVHKVDELTQHTYHAYSKSNNVSNKTPVVEMLCIAFNCSHSVLLLCANIDRTCLKQVFKCASAPNPTIFWK